VDSGECGLVQRGEEGLCEEYLGTDLDAATTERIHTLYSTLPTHFMFPSTACEPSGTHVGSERVILPTYKAEAFDPFTVLMSVDCTYVGRSRSQSALCFSRVPEIPS
jgi:hypothetical protein